MDHKDLSWLELADLVLRYAKNDGHESDVAHLLSQLAQNYAWPPLYQRYFTLFEENGFHLMPVHFYSPIPDTRALDNTIWEKRSDLPGIDMNDAAQLRFLRETFPRFRPEYDQIPMEPAGSPHGYYFNNGLFSGTDALALYCMVRHFQPGRILEVGSGFSSRLSAEAALRNGNTKLTCIEPYPDENLRRGFPGLTSLITRKVQDVPPATFLELGPNDILFIDSSHVVGIGGDVDYLFLEILPRLKPGVIVHVHDIFLPMAARRDWVLEERRFWTEQQLLHAFLIFNSRFEVLLANYYLSEKYPREMRETFPNSPWWGGGSFWMRVKIQ